MRALLKEWLSEAGYGIHDTAEREAENTGPVDLVIVSLYMPKQAGAPLVRKLQAAHPGAPMIALSGQFRSGLFGRRRNGRGAWRTAGHGKAPAAGGSAGRGARYDRCPPEARGAHMSSPSDSSSLQSRHPPLPASAAWGSHARCSRHRRVRGSSAYDAWIAYRQFTRTRPIVRSTMSPTRSPNKPRGAGRPSIFSSAIRRRWYTNDSGEHPAGTPRPGPCEPHGGSPASTPGHYRRCTGHAASPAPGDPHRPICLLPTARIFNRAAGSHGERRVHERTDHHSFGKPRRVGSVSPARERQGRFRRRG